MEISFFPGATLDPQATRVFKTPISRATLLAAVSLLAVLPFFWQGSPSGHDFEFHMFSWMDVLGQWKQGVVYPRWAALAHWGYGEARFVFYPPASWTLGAALGAFLPWRMVPGAYCWIVLTLAGAAMYRLAREWLEAPAALFAAAFYAVNPYHLVIVYWRSAYAELLTSALLPLLLLCVLRLEERSLRTALWLGMILAAAWLTNAPAAVIVHYSLAVLVALKAALDRSWRPLLQAGLAIMLGAGLASFYLVPAMYEQKWVNIGEVLSPGVRPQDNFLFTTIADPDHNRFNLFVSTIAAAEIGAAAIAVWFSRRATAKQRILWILLSAWIGASVLAMLSITDLLWRYLPELRFVQIPWRWLLCLNAALAMLLALLAMVQTPAPEGRLPIVRRFSAGKGGKTEQIPEGRLNLSSTVWSARVLVSAALFAVVLIAGYRIQPPWWDTAADIKEMSDAMSDATGNEGADEYVPAGADPYDVGKTAPRIAASGKPVPAKIQTWGPEERHFAVNTSSPENLTLRLFNYPAWEVTINGRRVDSRTTEGTGQMVIPVPAGKNDVQVRFRRTPDRTLGGAVSLISLAVLVAAWMKTRPRPAVGANA
jgi:6-pyruvoyl-tetrahydropterin synthase-like protein